MKYVILGYDAPDGEAKRKVHRTAHLSYLEPLHAAGRAILARRGGMRARAQLSVTPVGGVTQRLVRTLSLRK